MLKEPAERVKDCFVMVMMYTQSLRGSNVTLNTTLPPPHSSSWFTSVQGQLNVHTLVLSLFEEVFAESMLYCRYTDVSPEYAQKV